MDKLVKVEGSISPNSPELKVWEYEVTEVNGGSVYAKDEPHHTGASWCIAKDVLGEVKSDSSPEWFRKFVWLHNPTAEDVAKAQLGVLAELSKMVKRHVDVSRKMEDDLSYLLKTTMVPLSITWKESNQQ